MSAIVGANGPNASDVPYRHRVTSFAARERWKTLAIGFLRHHRRPLNNLIHLITTPLSLVAVNAFLVILFGASSILASVAYAIAIFCVVPFSVSFPSILVVFGCWAIAWLWQPVWWTGLIAFFVGYFGQDLAHVLCSERTYQSSYQGQSGFVKRLVDHTFFLVPLVVLASLRRRSSPLNLLVQRRAVLPVDLASPMALQDLAVIRNWACERHPDPERSVHYWPTDLCGEAAESFTRLAVNDELLQSIRRHHGAGYTVDPVHGMNELYVTGPPKKSTSDTVFYMSHVDGPFSVFPGARLYRCMVAASENASVTTHFPMTGTSYEQPESVRLQTGQSVAFDFNRELHYITRETVQNSTPRVNLKLHFVAYPSNLPSYGHRLARWTTSYDIRARALFLQTIAPDRVLAKLKAKWVLTSTKFYEWVVRFLGWSNLAGLGAVILIAAGLQSWAVLVALVSFVHYAIYIATLRHGPGVSFGSFVRDATFWKAVSMSCLVAVWIVALTQCHPFMMATSATGVSIGLGLAATAAMRLGRQRTFFSAELGFDPPEQVVRFPYGVIWHPMIVGMLLGLTAMLMVCVHRPLAVVLIAAHIACYLVVLVQELTSRPVHWRSTSPCFKANDSASNPQLTEPIEQTADALVT